MQKLLFSVLFILPMGISSNARIDPQALAQHIEAQVAQSATPEAMHSVDKMVGLLADKKLRAKFVALVRSHGKESFGFFAENLRAVLNADERAQLIELLDEVYDWYVQIFALSMDTKALQTPVGQEAYMQLQMKPILMLQEPLAAAIVKRIFELEKASDHDNNVLNELRTGFGALVKEQYDFFKTELSK